jgi:hypothetical protein
MCEIRVLPGSMGMQTSLAGGKYIHIILKEDSDAVGLLAPPTS